jgi:hypothetical protein
LTLVIRNPTAFERSLQIGAHHLVPSEPSASKVCGRITEWSLEDKTVGGIWREVAKALTGEAPP